MDPALNLGPGSGPGELFQLLRDGVPRTRADLLALTGLSRSTIATRVEQLTKAGLIAPAGEACSTGGRPPATFAFHPKLRLALGVDLGATHARIAVTDLASTILTSTDAALPIAAGPDAVLGWVARTGKELVTALGRDMDDVACVGIGLPGPVEHSTGRPVNPPIMPAWSDVDVPGILFAEFRAPILVDNDVNVMALGEYRTVWPNVADILYVKVATGIGAGIISEGRLHRGAQGAAGDIGHLAVPNAPNVTCRCGNLGCLEAIASGQAVASALLAAGTKAHNGADVVALVRTGNTTAIQAVRQAGRDIGSVLAACVSMLNPSLIIMGGVLAQAGEHLIAGIREIVYQRSLPLATQHLRILTSQAGTQAGVLGASAMAVDHILSPGLINTMLIPPKAN